MDTGRLAEGGNTSFFKDLKLLFKEIEWLPYLLHDNESDRPFIYPESIDLQLPTPWNLTIDFLLHGGAPQNPATMNASPDAISLSPGNTCWFYINGMLTDPGAMLLQQIAINSLFGCKVNLLYNRTNGVINDVLEVALGRVLSINEEVVTTYALDIASQLAQGRRCILIVHSQGGIMASHLMEVLASSKAIYKTLENLEIYTFSAGFNRFKKPHPCVHAEHFANEFDYVARVGVMTASPLEGVLYVRKGATGHLLNKNYLSGFYKGLYCGGKSRLYSHLRGKQFRGS